MAAALQSSHPVKERASLGIQRLLKSQLAAFSISSCRSMAPKLQSLLASLLRARKFPSDILASDPRAEELVSRISTQLEALEEKAVQRETQRAELDVVLAEADQEELALRGLELKETQLEKELAQVRGSFTRAPPKGFNPAMGYPLQLPCFVTSLPIETDDGIERLHQSQAGVIQMTSCRIMRILWSSLVTRVPFMKIELLTTITTPLCPL